VRGFQLESKVGEHSGFDQVSSLLDKVGWVGLAFASKEPFRLYTVVPVITVMRCVVQPSTILKYTQA
jgi:hypothetical protein